MIENGNLQLLSPVLKFRKLNSTENRLRVIPNPVKDQMQVIFTAGNAGQGTLSLYDQSGKRIYTSTLSLQKGNNSIVLYCLSNQPDGLYQLVIAADNRLITERVMHKK